MNINIPGIDTGKGIINSGSLEFYKDLLNDVYKLIDEKCDLVESYLKENDIQNYTVQVHSLKSTCRMIGATDLGEEFFTLEKLGKENNTEQIRLLTPDVLNSFRSLKPYLEPYAVKSSDVKNVFDKDAVVQLLQTLILAIDDFNLDTAENTAKQLSEYNWDPGLSKEIETLSKLVSNIDYEEAKDMAGRILECL